MEYSWEDVPGFSETYETEPLTLPPADDDMWHDYRLQLEVATLAAPLLKPELWDETLTIVDERCFRFGRTRAIFQEMNRLQNKAQGIDMIRLCEQIRESNAIARCGGPGFLGRLTDGNPSTTQAARVLASIAARERHSEALLRAAELASRGEQIDPSLLEPPGKSEGLKVLPLELPTAPEPTRWIVNGWAADLDLIICAGEPGVGKSFLALDYAIGLATGTDWCGERVLRQQRVLYVDEENSEQVLSARVEMLSKGSNRPKPNGAWLKVLHNNGISYSRPQRWNELRAMIKFFRPDWIVLDALVRFHTANENDNSEMARLFNEAIKPLAAMTDSGLLVLHHLNKPSDTRPGGQNRIRGASDIAAAFGSTWIVERIDNGRIRLTQTKNRHQQEARPKTIRFVTNDTGGFRLVGI